MANIPISSLPTATGLDGSELVPIVQGGTTRRTTTSDIAGLVGGFVPTTRAINTESGSGLSGGGTLATDLSLKLDVDNLPELTSPTISDYLAINDSPGNVSSKISPPNFYKTVSGLTHKVLPTISDLMLVYSVSDSDSRYSTVGEVLASAGSLPIGGTTGQPLIKVDDTDFNTEWATLPVIGGGTGAVTLDDHGILLGQGTSAVVSTVMTDGQLLIGQTGADPEATTLTGDVTIDAGGVTAIGANKVTNTMLRQSAALSVIGNSTNGVANVGDISAASDFQILRRSGTSIGFGSIDLSQSNAVGSSILGPLNGGTGIDNGSSTLTLAGPLATSGAFSTVFTMTGDTAVTVPTSGTLATTSGASIPAVAQGDLLYGSATNVLSTLAKSTTASRYLANTGTSNDPAWDQVNLANGVTGTLPNGNGGTGFSTYATGDTLYASAANTLSKLSGNTTTAKQYLSQTGTGSASAAPVWATIGGSDITGAALTASNDTNVTLTLGGAPTTALLRAASIAAGWTGQLSLSRGGTNASLTASNGGVLYSTASAFAVLAGTATANRTLLSGASGAPTWSTATFPTTTTAGTILASASVDTVTATATPVLGVNGGTGGQITLNGATSGSATIKVAAVAGTTNFQLPVGNGSNGYVLVTDGSGNTSWSSTSSTVSSVFGRAGSVVAVAGDYSAAQIGSTGVFYKINTRVITASGTYTPSTGLVYAIIECVGGGGAGGGGTGSTGQYLGGGGGGSGSYSRISASASTIGSSQTVTIGAGGTGGSGGGGNGGTTSVGTLCTANGGDGGASFGNGSGGSGGTAGTGNIAAGNAGSSGISASSGLFFAVSGGGAPSYFGGATVGVVTGSSGIGVSAAANTGAGGSGSASTNTTSTVSGGSGGSGLVIITEFLNQ